MVSWKREMPGEFDADGNLFITDRIKELMKTSNGKYIAPQYIEGKIGKDKFIEQIAIIADAKKICFSVDRTLFW